MKMTSAGRIDFLIFAPLDEEVAALKEAFDISAEPHVMDDGSECYNFHLPTPAGGATILIVQLCHMGVLGAAVMTTKLIGQRRPWSIVSFGIAGGFVKEGISKRDVFIPDVVFYYEPAKESVKDVDLSGSPKHQSESRVRPFFPSRHLEIICRRVKHVAQRELSIRCKIGGPLASGEKKVADLDGPTVQRVREIHSKTLAIEMEAAGVGAAVEGWPELSRDCHFFVIKGISDDASEAEDATRDDERLETRRTAATNAARFLRRVIEEARPNHLEEVPEIEHAELRRLGKAFVATLPPHLAITPLNDLELRRMLHPIESLPPLIYHWRLHPVGIHWVDFAHLLVLRRIQDRVGKFPVHLLITDLDATEEDRQRILGLVSRIFLESIKITWYREIDDLRPQYVRHALALGFDDAARQTLRQTRNRLGLRDGNLISEEWLQYIIWSIRDQERDRPRAIVFAWHQNAAIYDQLLNAIGQEYLIIPGRDFMLNGTLGKFDVPGRDIIVEPPEYRSLLSWMESELDEGRVTDMSMYLSPFPSADDHVLPLLSDPVLNVVLPQFPRIHKACSEHSANPYQHAVRSLLSALATWNREWFGQA